MILNMETTNSIVLLCYRSVLQVIYNTGTVRSVIKVIILSKMYSNIVLLELAARSIIWFIFVYTLYPMYLLFHFGGL